MELVTGALPSVLGKLGELLGEEYNLQKEAKGGIKFLREELDTIKAALEHISKIPVDKLKDEDKVWARNIRELSYDIDDNIDMFMVHCKGDKKAQQQGFTDKILDKLRQLKVRRKFATELRGIKSRVKEVSERRDRYKIDTDVAEPVKIDPRLLAQHAKVTELVGIDEARHELIQLLMEPGKGPKQQNKIVSVVGFGGLGKTTLANVVYEELRRQFDCSAFVSVSQTPDLEKLLKDIMYQVSETNSDASINVAINKLKEFLHEKRYFIVIDDIWDIQHWRTIRCALPDNDFECKIITTTRILNIAKDIGGAYNMKPLSPHNSRTLLYRRIFGTEDEEKSHDREFIEVSDRILKKCAGVPLAIITISSLLAIQGKNKWYEVYSSIGTGMENSLDMENMRKILLLSYYHLPSYLRTCLLYLSFFPEDYKVDKDRLIWMWIAEGFIKCEKQVIRLYEVGQSYLNELINRSMVQPIYTGHGELSGCRVHDIVLEVVCSLSSEENFIVLNDLDHRSPRRLSLQNGRINHSKIGPTEQVRSVVVFPSAINVMPPIKKFRVLRVLDLEDCDLSQGYSLEYLGKLHHLRYLGLRSTGITQLPTEIVNLQLLQTLDTRSTTGWSYIPSLPTIPQLGNLIRLLVDCNTRLCKGIRRLRYLEVLSDVRIDDSNTEIVEDLGYLRELRVLHVDFVIKLNETLVKCLVESLQKLEKLQEIVIWFNYDDDATLDDWVVGPCHLRYLRVINMWFSTLPAWIDPLKLVDLYHLTISVRKLQPDGLEILGRLPALRSLELGVCQIIGGFIIGAGFFPRLLWCEIGGDVGHVAFHQGAMPLLERLFITLRVRVAGEIAHIKDLGLEYLPSLKEMYVRLRSGGASKEEVEDAEDALRHAAEIHRNRPDLSLSK